MTETQLKADIQKALDQLGIPRWRMQAGGYRGRTRGLPKGTPDILAAPTLSLADNFNPFADVSGTAWIPVFLWIEVKKPKEKPTQDQVDFSFRVIAKGHFWIVARSLDDVLGWLKEHKAR